MLCFQAYRSGEVGSGLDSEAGRTERAGELFVGSLWRSRKRSVLRAIRDTSHSNGPAFVPPPGTHNLHTTEWRAVYRYETVRHGGGGLKSYGIEMGGEKNERRKEPLVLRSCVR